jgi:hypothetical protein
MRLNCKLLVTLLVSSASAAYPQVHKGCAEGWTVPLVTPACEADSSSCDTLQRSNEGDAFIGELFFFAASPEAFLEQNGLPLDTPHNACFPSGDVGDEMMIKL